MEIRRASGILGAAFISIGLVACGGPDIDKAKADFENPSGKTADKNGVIAAQGKQDASKGVTGSTAGGIPGFGLTATGKSTGFAKASVARFMLPRAEEMRARLSNSSMRPFALNVAQDGGGDCGAAEYAAASADIMGDVSSDSTSGSASMSFTVDFSSCSGSGLTGTADYDYDVEYDFSGGMQKFDITASVSMHDVCETDSGNCVNGDMIVNMASNDAGFDMLMAWDMTAKQDGKEIASKGGIRFGFGLDSAKIEILVYVNTADGEEWSYVLEATQNFDGSGSLKVRGSDGTADCTWTSDGTGSCTGDAGTLEWTAEESDAVESEDWYSEG